MPFANAELFPISVDVGPTGHLTIGGCDAVDLAGEFGTPLYVYDEDTLRDMCRQFVTEFSDRYPNSRVVYGSKAFANRAVASLVAGEGLGVDVVSGGELALAIAAGFRAETIYFHGNNKSPDEIEMAMDCRVGRIVVDSFHEMNLVEDIATRRGIVQDIMLRISPDVDPHTHTYTTTGILDSKFGFPIATGQAEEAIGRALSATAMDLVGVHFHLGSPIFDVEPYTVAIDTVLKFVSGFKSQGLDLREFSPGGGFAIGYVGDQPPPPIGVYAEAIAASLRQRAGDLGLGTPMLIVEPGRSIVGRAGVAMYTVGAIKDIPSVRKYVSLDGGMGDNIRPALYGARYEAAVANRMNDPLDETVTLVGKYCESGDILISDIRMPVLEAGDLIAVPASGAYAPPMASNYNLSPRPAIVLVKDGVARLIRRRETYDDLMAMDVNE